MAKTEELRQPNMGKVEDLLAQITALNEEKMPEELKLWVASELTLNGLAVRQDIAMSIVLDALLGLGYWPDGYTRADDGLWYSYRKTPIG